MKKFSLTQVLMGSGYLVVSWYLLLWLNFQLAASPMVHFVVLPTLMLITALGAGLMWRRGCDCAD